uniref:NADP-dependent oxidoreductase domain-containing protein n=1 Tax=Zonotrichia albicollis TaxID=44394 RepID=A0A8D2MLX0_ZONAL
MNTKSEGGYKTDSKDNSTSHRGGYCHGAVVHALQQCGVRHIDTAKRYGCEHLLQRAIRDSGVKREDLWITTKLWHSDYGYDNTKKACLESCERLGVEYLGEQRKTCIC